MRLASKTVYEWNSHLEILSFSQLKENSRQCLLLRTDVLLKKVVKPPL